MSVVRVVIYIVVCMSVCRVKGLLSQRSVRAQAVAATYKFLNELISDDDIFEVFVFSNMRIFSLSV